jgi:hypothetical protein
MSNEKVRDGRLLNVICAIMVAVGVGAMLPTYLWILGFAPNPGEGRGWAGTLIGGALITAVGMIKGNT